MISVDLLGYGSSDKPDDAGDTFSPLAQAGRVRALLQSLGIERYGIVMHDMGGLVAWELLREDVRRVSHLVVLNTIIHKQGFEHPDFEPGMLTRQMTKAMSNRLTSAAALELTFRNLGLTGDEALSEEECFGYVRPMREGAAPALYAFYSSLNDDLYQRLEENKSWFEQYTGDTLVVWGELDEILTTEQLPFLVKHLGVASENLHIFPDKQHFIAEEMPTELVQLIADHL